jgi:hypothetical protein
METIDFDKEFTFVYNTMKQDLNAYGENIKDMENGYGTVYNFFKAFPESLVEWRDWFLGL